MWRGAAPLATNLAIRQRHAVMWRGAGPLATKDNGPARPALRQQPLRHLPCAGAHGQGTGEAARWSGAMVHGRRCWSEERQQQPEMKERRTPAIHGGLTGTEEDEEDDGER